MNKGIVGNIAIYHADAAIKSRIIFVGVKRNTQSIVSFVIKLHAEIQVRSLYGNGIVERNVSVDDNLACLSICVNHVSHSLHALISLDVLSFANDSQCIGRKRSQIASSVECQATFLARIVDIGCQMSVSLRDDDVISICLCCLYHETCLEEISGHVELVGVG